MNTTDIENKLQNVLDKIYASSSREKYMNTIRSPGSTKKEIEFVARRGEVEDLIGCRAVIHGQVNAEDFQDNRYKVTDASVERYNGDLDFPDGHEHVEVKAIAEKL